MSKIMSWTFVFILIGLFSGCSTLTRTTSNAAQGVANTAVGFGTGLVKDGQDTTNAIIKADQWFRENCW